MTLKYAFRIFYKAVEKVCRNTLEETRDAMIPLLCYCCLLQDGRVVLGGPGSFYWQGKLSGVRSSLEALCFPFREENQSVAKPKKRQMSFNLPQVSWSQLPQRRLLRRIIPPTSCCRSPGRFRPSRSRGAMMTVIWVNIWVKLDINKRFGWLSAFSQAWGNLQMSFWPLALNPTFYCALSTSLTPRGCSLSTKNVPPWQILNFVNTKSASKWISQFHTQRDLSSSSPISITPDIPGDHLCHNLVGRLPLRCPPPWWVTLLDKLS